MVDTVDVQRDVAYASRGDRTLQLDIYHPPGGCDGMPAVVYFHGGGWARGARTDRADARLRPIAAGGVVVVSASYRFSHEALWPAQLTDAAAAVSFVVEQAAKLRADPTAVSVWGASAGGHIASVLGACNGRAATDLSGVGTLPPVRSAVAFFAPSDLVAFQTDPPDDDVIVPAFAAAAQKPQEAPEARLVGASRSGTHTDALHAASPVHHVHPGSAPTLLVTGNRDALMPLAQPRRMAAALANVGVPHQLLIVDGATHEDEAFHTPAVLGAVAGWIRGFECAAPPS